MDRPARRRWSLGGAALLAAVAMAGHGVAPRPRAEACGACACAVGEPAYRIHPASARDVPLNARILVKGPLVAADTVTLWNRRARVAVPVEAELAGETAAEGLWIRPLDPLEPDTSYEVRVAGAEEFPSSFTTSSTTDTTAPVITSVDVVPEGGSLRGVCDRKVGVELRIGSEGEVSLPALVQVDVRGTDGSARRSMLFAVLDDVYFGRWDGDASAWGGNCLGDAHVEWLEGGVRVDLEVTVFDDAGNASEPFPLEDVRPMEVDAPGCPDGGGPVLACGLVR